jgi:predicted AAA+ superfamily ATPase
VEIQSCYPMSFLEFLLALGDKKSVDVIASCTPQTQIPEIVHAHLWERLKWYFVTGGLPEVVMTFCMQQNDLNAAFKSVREKQNQLLFAYYADFAKHSGKENALHIERVWRAVPQQLAQSQNASASRFQFTGVVPGIDRYQRLAGAINWLISAGLVLPASITNHAEIPLMAFCKEALFKLYCCDVGLLGAMIDLPPKSILQYNYGSYKGYFAENFVAQELSSLGEKLYCWQQTRSEIEFLRTADTSVIPLEVKSGMIVKAKSLEKFAGLYHPLYCDVLSGKTLHIDADTQIRNYPLYLAGQLPRFSMA